MRIKEQCIIKYDTARGVWCVAIGISLVHFGTIWSCEEWARQNGVPVRNQAEINRIKYQNMPTWECMS